MTLFETTALKMSDISETSVLGKIITKRSEIFKMSQIAENSVIFPKVCGAFSHELRAWIACYISKKANHIKLANKFLKNANKKATWTNPNCKTKIALKILIPFVEKVSNNTKNVEANDITKLQKAGLADEDIVRLCQLIAFVSFQIRVITGLQLINEGKNE
tara:strand:+ start:1552 stop:2034 length:483 start_codon:yes stop_codon:yes gene_type:complete